jgi:Fe-S cluster assembly ATPase SufC
MDGRIVRSGGAELALELEETGYGGMEVNPPEANAPDANTSAA